METPIEYLLQEMSFSGMKDRWISLKETKQLHELSLQDGLKILLQAEKECRNNRRFERLRHQAKFRYTASLEELQYDNTRGMNKEQIGSFASADYLKKGEAILITGATGCGKSFLASALGHQACAQGYKVLYFNLQKLMIKTKMTRLDGSLVRFMDRIAKMDLLIIDDFGLRNFESQQQTDFMEIIEDRHAQKSTIIASQLPVSSWYEIIGEETIADAILDRLVHTSHRVELKGESRRKPRT